MAALAILACIGVAPLRAQKESGMPPDMARYFVGLIRKGPTWTGEVNETTMTMQKAHLANIQRLVEEGKLVLAGPFEGGEDLRGLFFFSVETIEEAQALVQTDPSVQAKHLVVDLIPWWGPASLAELAGSVKHDAGRAGGR
jgi:uncharacterized protein YciI